MTSLKKKTTSLPKKPGVYLFKDKNGTVIYVGKAVNLKSRVASYFQPSANLESAKQIMVTRIKDLDYIMVDSETEALFLETVLIKKYHPRYNIIMKDDKNFIYIKINLSEDFPSVTTVRRIVKDKARYFGPYTSAKNVRFTIKYLKKIFPIKICKNKPDDPCFEYQIHRCAGHNTSSDSKSEYQRVVKNFIRFLEGQTKFVLKDLKEQMKHSSVQQAYEKAAVYRDRIEAIERVLEQQKVVLPTEENLDFLSLVRQDSQGCINLFVFRVGKLVSRKNFILKNIDNQSDGALMASFIEQYYTQSTEHPQSLILEKMPERHEEIAQLLQLKISTAQRGKKAQILKLGMANALDTLAKSSISSATEQKKAHDALDELKNKLNLKTVPHRIETYDISNIQGQNAVGSMVVFEDGQPKKSEYRKFKIKNFTQANDPGMLSEIIERRFKHISDKPKTNWPKPDLIILDGGKGQLNVVLDSLNKLNEAQDVPKHDDVQSVSQQEMQGVLQKESTRRPFYNNARRPLNNNARRPRRVHLIIPPLVALAKKNEELYIPDKKNPLILSADSPALYLFQRMRDEAHRFAIGFYRQTHRKKAVKSKLDEIPGIGPKTKKKLIQHFGSVRKIQQVSETELSDLVGNKTAKIIMDMLG